MINTAAAHWLVLDLSKLILMDSGAGGCHLMYWLYEVVDGCDDD